MRARLVSGGYGFTKTVIPVAAPSQRRPPTSPSSSRSRRRSPTSGSATPGRTARTRPSASWPTTTSSTWTARDEAIWPGTHVPAVHAGDRRDARAVPGLRRQAARSTTSASSSTSSSSAATATGPTLVWEYWDGFGWQRLLVERRDPRPPACRGSCRSSGPRTAGRWRASASRAIGCARASTRTARRASRRCARSSRTRSGSAQRQTVVDEPLGDEHRPAGPGVHIPSGADPARPGDRGPRAGRAAGRRRVADPRRRSCSAATRARSQELETELGGEGDVQPDVPPRSAAPATRPHQAGRGGLGAMGGAADALLLRPDGPALRASTARAAGVLLGDGEHGRVPPAGAAIAARLYRTGGGARATCRPARSTRYSARSAGSRASSTPRPPRAAPTPRRPSWCGARPAQRSAIAAARLPRRTTRRSRARRRRRSRSPAPSPAATPPDAGRRAGSRS